MRYDSSRIILSPSVLMRSRGEDSARLRKRQVPRSCRRANRLHKRGARKVHSLGKGLS
jgi:hypothetical protein